MTHLYARGSTYASVVVQKGSLTTSATASLRQTSSVQSGFSRICRHSKAGSLYIGPSWKDVATSYSTKAHFQNHVRAFQRVLRSGERTHRSTSSLPLPNRLAQYSGQFVWPTSTLIVSSPLGMGVLIRLKATASITPSALYSHWLDGSLSRALLGDFRSPGHVDRVFSHSSGSSSPWWFSFTSSPRVTPMSLVLSPPASLLCLRRSLCWYPRAHSGSRLCLGIRALRLHGMFTGLPFSCCGHMEILTWSFENFPGPHEAEGLHTTWLCRG